MIGKKLNPFDFNFDKSHLFNIATGKSAKEESAAVLLSIYQTSCEMQRTNRHKLYAFQTECGTKKISNKDEKTIAPCMVRDILGRVLRLSLKNSIDMAEVLQHPLIPVLLSLSHVDWTLLKSPKSALMKHLD